MADPIPCPRCGTMPEVCKGLLGHEAEPGMEFYSCPAVFCKNGEEWVCGEHMQGLAAWNHQPAVNALHDRIAALETLLARNLVFDRDAAEDALEALGGFSAMVARVEAHKAGSANPTPHPRPGRSVSPDAPPFNGTIDPKE